MKLLVKCMASVLLMTGVSTSLFAAESLFKPLNKQQVDTDANQPTIIKNLSSRRISSHRVMLNTGVLEQSTQQIEIDLDVGLSLLVDRQNSRINSQGSLVWRGQKSMPNGLIDRQTQVSNSTILIRTEKGITGSIRVDGKLFKVRPVKNGIHEIIQVDESKMPEDHPPAEMQILEQAIDLSTSTNNFEHFVATDYSAPSPRTVANPNIQILVAYTAAAKSAVSDIQALIQLAVEETNSGYINSGITATMELMHTYEVSYSESNFSTDLSYFRNNNDGVMDEVHSKRDQHGADVAVLMTNVNDYCGLASAIGASSSTAFAAVYHDCATGYYSFGHEVGHLQAARHNPENDPTNTPYAYGHGYQYTSGGWRTVMAYNCSPSCSRINWWSNPNMTRGGVAMGTSSRNDNARVLNQTAATIAAFKGGTTVDNVLTNGVAKSNLSGAKNESTNFTMDVPASATSLVFVASGGSGDADLHVKFGSTATTSNYDCRPYKNGNNETCTITNIQAGTYSVMLNGYSAFSGLSLTGSYTEGDIGETFGNTANYSIPDNSSTGVSSPVNVSRSGNSATVSIEVNIVHTYIGDLTVDLIHPDGTVYNLHNRSGGSANNINQTYSASVGGKESSGTWNLKVRDSAGADTGYIDSWSVTF